MRSNEKVVKVLTEERLVQEMKGNLFIGHPLAASDGVCLYLEARLAPKRALW